MKEEKIKKIVKERYGKIAKQNNTCCLPANSCCGSPNSTSDISKNIGYTDKELDTIPEDSNLGLGCGNPVALASLKEGETVLDLGSGAGIDCFLAAKKVGRNGQVIGVDMTPEMIEKAKENAKKSNYSNVEFRLGEIENLPVDDDSVDVIISNCVINLVPDKAKAFKEALRVLKPNGRLMISDIVLLKELPEFIRKSVEAYVGCVAGAMMKEEYIEAIKTAGFKEVKIINEASFPSELITCDPTIKKIIKKLKIPVKKLEEIANSVVSIKVSGIKPN